ncbi:MAG: hypothetical protein KGL95_06910, partial [Patescibacteria group bacterium]|nr:hypothetical protein [Patescibacteria group bacterium]
ESLFPTPAAPPTVSFGKLPKIIFPLPTTTMPSFTVNTVSGSLPVFDDRITVYKLAQAQTNFSSIEKAKSLAATNNFQGDPTPISDTVYQWTKMDPNKQTLSLNIQTFDLSFSTDYLHDPQVLSATNLGTPSDAIAKLTTFLNGFEGTLPTDIDATRTQTTLFSIQNNTLIPALSLSDAQIIRVDYYQSDIDNIPIYYPHFPQSLMTGFIASGQSDQTVVAATFIHKSVDSQTSATYPILTAQEALDKLKKGEGFLANYDNPTKPAIIRTISLGYFLSDDPAQQYLMPIVVFQGDNNFYAFTPALRDEWVQK